MRFVDEVEVVLVAGRGGDGACSFRRDRRRPRGGPDGGDGGRGGHVILVADPSLNTLERFRGRRVLKAAAGRPGGPRDMTGAYGPDLRVPVPPGTVAYDPETGQRLAELDAPGQEVVICRGGRGGRGNAWFKSPTNRAPRNAQPGLPGAERRLRLELKLLADVGLIGLPNAGKSTLISRVSAARPRVADYPFTTLVPQLGVVSMGLEGDFVVADVPGLVPGASRGVGLGHRFLRHVERCRLLLHLVSPLPADGQPSDPIERHRCLVHELGAFSQELARRPQRIVITKADAVSQEDLDACLRRFERETGSRPMATSSVTGAGLEDLVRTCWSDLRSMPRGYARGS